MYLHRRLVSNSAVDLVSAVPRKPRSATVLLHANRICKTGRNNSQPRLYTDSSLNLLSHVTGASTLLTAPPWKNLNLYRVRFV